MNNRATQKKIVLAFLGSPVVKNSHANAGGWNMGSITGLGRFYMPQGT